ncbi:PRLR protein, partial [Amia calva]|nr:PRLR protein [Amia calva]
PPGKPNVQCRSPEKETFTCWWEPGSDGGLPTNYSLFYRKENSETVNECPDYKTAGKNSCFFDKNHTTIWVTYNITVVATNALGSNFSDPKDVDVVYIVQPHKPENLTVELQNNDQPYLVVNWEPPRKADTRSGWITLIYELRIKREKEDTWEMHFAGQQKQYNLFSLHPGEIYMIQVRCKPDHGFWSEWSSTSYIEIPDYIQRDRSMWILIAILSTFVFLILLLTMNLKLNSVKQWLLPPVPGPKIKGFDTQLLKYGKSEDMLSALVSQGFPPTSDCEDLLVEFLEVDDSDEREQVIKVKDLQENRIKSANNSLDNDSGRGSCDSHTLLLENSNEPKMPGLDNEHVMKEGHSEATKDRSISLSWNSNPVRQLDNLENADRNTKTWPTSFLSHHPQKQSFHSIPEIQKQGYISSNLQFMANQPDQAENNTDPRPIKISTGYGNLQGYSEFCVKIPENQMTQASAFPPSKFMEYVEVQKVNQENILILKAKTQESPQVLSPEFTGQEYTKVSGVVNDNVLLLQRDADASCSSDHQE